MKITDLSQASLPLQPQAHSQESIAREQKLVEERDKLAHDVKAITGMMTKYRTQSSRDLRVMEAKVEESQKEREELQRVLDQRDKDVRLQILKVKRLKRTLRDLAFGELKLKEANGVLPAAEMDTIPSSTMSPVAGGPRSAALVEESFGDLSLDTESKPAKPSPPSPANSAGRSGRQKPRTQGRVVKMSDTTGGQEGDSTFVTTPEE